MKQKTFLTVLIFTILFIIHCYYFYPFFVDDSLISLRYVKRFIEGHGLNWNEGKPVEGYSNLSWVLGVSFLGKLGFDLIFASRLLGVICGIFIIYIITKYYVEKTFFPLILGLAFLVFSSTFAIWTIGGLEQPIYALFICSMIYFVFKILDDKKFDIKYFLLLSFSLGMLAISRPDGLLFSAITGLFLVLFFFKIRIKPGKILKFILLTSVFPIVLYGGQLLFRLYYYGEWWPNTAYVKINPTNHHFLEGFKYNLSGLYVVMPFSMISFALILYLTLKKQAKGIYLLLVSSIWMTYTSIVGGDVFLAYRHFT